MPTQISFVQLTARAHFASGFTGHNAGASKSIEFFRGRSLPPGENAAHDVTKSLILCKGEQNTPQMIAERSFVSTRLRLECAKINLAGSHLIEAAPGQVGLATEELETGGNLRITS